MDVRVRGNAFSIMALSKQKGNRNGSFYRFAGVKNMAGMPGGAAAAGLTADAVQFVQAVLWILYKDEAGFPGRGEIPRWQDLTDRVPGRYNFDYIARMRTRFCDAAALLWGGPRFSRRAVFAARSRTVFCEGGM